MLTKPILLGSRCTQVSRAESTVFFPVDAMATSTGMPITERAQRQNEAERLNQLADATGISLLLNIPPSIDQDTATEQIKNPVGNLVPRGDLRAYNPKIFISYATGKRSDDSEGCGPGMIYAKALVDQFRYGGFDTLSGLHMIAFVHWKDHYIGKLGTAPPKVLIIALTPAFLQSLNCLEEVYVAMQKGVQILPVIFEYPYLMANDERPPWEAANASQSEWREEVLKKLVEINTYPPPPSTVLDNPSYHLGEIFKRVNNLVQKLEETPHSIDLVDAEQGRGPVKKQTEPTQPLLMKRLREHWKVLVVGFIVLIVAISVALFLFLSGGDESKFDYPPVYSRHMECAH